MDYLFHCSFSYFYPIHGVACFHDSRSDEDTIREIMADAIRSAKQRIAKAASYMEYIDPFLFSVINKPSEDPTNSKGRADNTLDNANNDYGRNAKIKNKSPLPALLATAPTLHDGSLGCGEKSDMPPHGSGTSAGQLTAPEKEISLEREKNTSDLGEDTEQIFTFLRELENGSEQGRVTNQKQNEIFVEKRIASIKVSIASYQHLASKF